MADYSLKEIMINLLNIILIAFISISLSGCISTEFSVKKQPDIKLEISKPYKTNTDALNKSELPKMVFLTEDFQQTIGKKAFYVAFNQKEFKKIMKLSEMFNVQIDIIYKQDDIINGYIFEINQLKLLIQEKDLKVRYLIENWEYSENNYRKESSSHFRTKIVNTIVECTLLIIILALAI